MPSGCWRLVGDLRDIDGGLQIAPAIYGELVGQRQASSAGIRVRSRITCRRALSSAAFPRAAIDAGDVDAVHWFDF